MRLTIRNIINILCLIVISLVYGVDIALVIGFCFFIIVSGYYYFMYAKSPLEQNSEEEKNQLHKFDKEIINSLISLGIGMFFSYIINIIKITLR